MRALRNAVVGAVVLPFLAAGLAGAQALDDAAIVGIFDAANGWDIETGSLAAQKATKPTVKSFGQMLAHDHEGVRKQARDLAAKLGVTPTPVAADFALNDLKAKTAFLLRDADSDYTRAIATFFRSV